MRHSLKEIARAHQPITGRLQTQISPQNRQRNNHIQSSNPAPLFEDDEERNAKDKAKELHAHDHGDRALAPACHVHLGEEVIHIVRTTRVKLVIYHPTEIGRAHV